MKLSQKVWQQIQPVYQAILDHPFNQGLIQGTLAPDIFSYYIAQDILYLRDYGRVLQRISTQVQDAAHKAAFLQFAQETLLAENLVHQFFLHATDTIKPTLATVAYTNYLSNTAAMESCEVAVAAVLPCFWIYQQVGIYSAANTVADNPYARWIDTYNSPEFSNSVITAITIFDQLAEGATVAIQEKMCDAFYNSSLLEWHFWHDAYNKRQFNEHSQ